MLDEILDRCSVVSVVRDYVMYNRCIVNNHNCAGCEITTFDNRTLNLGIPTLYNKFLASYDYNNPGWIVFCHEDFSFDEPVIPLLQGKPKNALMGALGATGFLWPFGYTQWRPVGLIDATNKDLSWPHKVGRPCKLGDHVDTYDCCCLIGHSSLFKSGILRFDENLPFDLYVEDICIAANESPYKIKSVALPMKCTHHSTAFVTDRYKERLNYFNAKWKNVAYCGPCSWCLGGKRLSSEWISGWLNDNVILPSLRFLRLHK